MFLASEDTESGVLRQGDVISEIHIIGALNLRAKSIISSQGGEITGWMIPNAPILGPAVVLSHSCEIDRANTTKITSIILSPLRDINAATPPEKQALLIRNNIIDPDNPQPAFLKYFYLSPHQLLPQYSHGSVVDFSKCFSVRNQCYDDLVQKKVLQMEPEMAKNMALRLGYYFYR